jgi:hypothetical protein
MSPISFTRSVNLKPSGYARCIVLVATLWYGEIGVLIRTWYIFFVSTTAPVIDPVFHAVALIWFLIIAVSGIYNTTTHPGIFRAFDPSRAVMRKSSQSNILLSYPMLIDMRTSLREDGKLRLLGGRLACSHRFRGHVRQVSNHDFQVGVVAA